MKTKAIVASVSGCVAMLCLAESYAQAPGAKPAANYPTRPVRIVIPYPPGGTSDILARLIGVKVTEAWGQQFIVENRTGANGNIGAEVVARAAPDGYTYLLTDIGNLSIAPSVYKLPFDPLKDLTTVTIVSYSPHLLTVHPSVPVKTTRELIALAKANPGKLNYPTGLGGAPHFAGMLFEQKAGVKWTYIGTRGGADSARMVASGESDLLFLGMLQTLPHVKNNRLKLIAVSSEKRVPSLPDTPTVGEGPGLAGFVTGSWQGILAPARVPSEIITKFNAELARVLHLPDMKEKLTSQGTDPVGNAPQDASKWMTGEHARMAKLIKDTGFKLE
ncbi:MAG: tripartite tricarboxylate transporter substrate binding protein [Burkholderiales bacterium]|nr:tripartite tricarboxylate transporter substrate binding protein [Burkholderiales bacterium]